ncbi:cobalamin biosynthesis protein CobD/CbiB [Alteromonas sp. a30]|uniref:cobalamin biosynthesis protein CobD/CbiB n=1 Tax=Alteromonas sp. a30 TaxID=2730917 RepID=UPI0022808908|nr:cobalamin biosynthesis protein [Alteromonas sp. a30]MCY7294496.1 adenosylcobinamide-phosphate synthase [Alteromonas sp. a30]
MTDELNQIANIPLLSIATMVVVMLLEKVIPWSARSHPLTLLNSMAKTMALKVHKDKSNSPAQQKISGALAIVVLSVPVVFIVAIVLFFAEFTFFFDGLLLLIALRFQPVVEGSKKIQQALEKRKKALARYELSRWTLRETESLSEMGICKATIETLLLRFGYQYMSVIFWYLIGGGIAALIYRFIYEMSQTWNIKNPHYKHFGRPVSWVSFILNWVPVRLTGVLFIVAVNLSKAIQAVRRQNGVASGHTLLLTLFGGALDIQLGGPAYYNKCKIRLPKCGGNKAPDSGDISRARLGILQSLAVFLAMLALVSAGLYSVR